MSYLDNLYVPPYYILDEANDRTGLISKIKSKLSSNQKNHTLYTYKTSDSDADRLRSKMRSLSNAAKRRLIRGIKKDAIDIKKHPENYSSFQLKHVFGGPVRYAKHNNAPSERARGNYSTGANAIGINKEQFKDAKKEYGLDRNNVKSLLSARNQQIKDRLNKSEKFKNLPEEKKNSLYTKMHNKFFKLTARPTYEHEKEHKRQTDTIITRLGRGGLGKAGRNYNSSIEKGDSDIDKFRRYAATPYEYGANLKARGMLTPQQSKELSLHQARPDKFKLRSISIDKDKAFDLAHQNDYSIMDNRKRQFGVDRMEKLKQRIAKRNNM